MQGSEAGYGLVARATGLERGLLATAEAKQQASNSLVKKKKRKTKEGNLIKKFNKHIEEVSSVIYFKYVPDYNSIDPNR